jgi:hypothetical protein
LRRSEIWRCFKQSRRRYVPSRVRLECRLAAGCLLEPRFGAGLDRAGTWLRPQRGGLRLGAWLFLSAGMVFRNQNCCACKSGPMSAIDCPSIYASTARARFQVLRSLDFCARWMWRRNLERAVESTRFCESFYFLGAPMLDNGTQVRTDGKTLLQTLNGRV